MNMPSAGGKATLMQLTDLLQPDCVKVTLGATDKYQAITELVDLLHEKGLLQDYALVLKTVMDREAVRSTGIGQGFAIPHGKCNAVAKPVMALGKLKQPIDFQSIDGRPVAIIVLLISPVEQTGLHIQILARVSRVMTDRHAREEIAQAASPEELCHIISKYELQTPS